MLCVWTEFMKFIREFFEQGYTTLAEFLYTHRIKTLVIILLITAGLVSQIPNIKFDLSTEGWLHETDPVRTGYHEFLAQFGNEDALIVCITPPEIFDLKFLKTLKTVHEEIEDRE